MTGVADGRQSIEVRAESRGILAQSRASQIVKPNIAIDPDHLGQIEIAQREVAPPRFLKAGANLIDLSACKLPVL